MGARKLARPDRSFRFASETDLQRLEYIVPLRTILNGVGSLATVDELSRRACRVLTVLAALHRAGNCGYRGVEVYTDVLAYHVRRLTGEPCKRTTCEEALYELHRAGLIESFWGTVQSVRDRDGNFRPKTIKINGRYQAARVRIWALTPSAVGLWAKRRTLKAVPACEPPAELPTDSTESKPNFVEKSDADPSELAEHVSAKSEFFCNTQKLGTSEWTIPVLTNGVLTDTESNELSVKHPLETDVSKEESPCGDVSTCPSSPSSTIEHERSDGATSAPKKRFEESASVLGVTMPPPVRPSRSAPNNYRTGRLSLLADLVVFLARFPSRKADAIYSRAKYETGLDKPSHHETALDWRYWINHWRTLDRSARFHALRKTIYPAVVASCLRAKPRPIPSPVYDAPPERSNRDTSELRIESELQRSVMISATRAARAAAVARGDSAETAKMDRLLKLLEKS